MADAGSPLNAVSTLASLATTSKYPTTGSGISCTVLLHHCLIAEDLKSVLWKRVKCSPVQLWHTWAEEPDCFGQIFRRSSFWPIKRNMLPLITHQPSLPYESCGDLEQLLWPWWWAEWKSEWDEGSRPQPKSHKAMDTFRTTLSPPSTDVGHLGGCFIVKLVVLSSNLPLCR